MTAQIVAIAHHAGGTGKTTTALNLAYALSGPTGGPVLVVDLDPQADLSLRLGVTPRGPTLAQVLLANRGAPAVQRCTWPGTPRTFDVVAGDLEEMADLDQQLAPARERERRLRQALTHYRREYDYILLDCPPALSLLTTNALYAADSVLIPVQAQDKAVRQLRPLLRTIADIRGYRIDGPTILGLLLTMTDATRQSHEAEARLREKHGTLVFRTTIPRRTSLADDGRYHAPIGVYALQNEATTAYTALAEEVLTHAAAPATC
jgi:chromosome partitioning protein